MMRESVDVVWDDYMKSTLRAVNLSNLEDLHVVA
jgi:hypothetical protein